MLNLETNKPNKGIIKLFSALKITAKSNSEGEKINYNPQNNQMVLWVVEVF